ncbi:MAG TPA: type II restriction endonuclease [Candidatus Thiothrix moscowensis]|uniref:type II restriction endonuclease n=1 Tax=unclassified Thiothrix TaxID=2636184 RepID=UPI0025FFB279|nr:MULTISPECIES: type II restriction endonuclease [unclassified Thiothrix]HRJ51907.1 type II restriction endonuclease [Candidatus Thiothrix moscowensis]HRJ92222.1 type II restriction endonuclease [Candidatus Thiothrix moscowensis]
MPAKQVSDYCEGVAAKYLSAVDADPKRSNQHEIGGLPSVGFKQYLGEPAKLEKRVFNARMVYLKDEHDTPEMFEDAVTWYDCRENQPHRSPEYRLYYKSNPVTELLNPGDFFLIAKLRDNSLLLAFTPANSSLELQLRALFGIDNVREKGFNAGNISKSGLLLPLRLLLEDLGIEAFRAEPDDDEWLARLLAAFGYNGFPATARFSAFARQSLENEVDAVAEADATLLAWMEREEKLFRIFERYFVQQRLREGFGEHGDDVDAFIAFSLSVQNRRKSRVGHAFEGHLDTLFRLHGLHFEQGRGKGRVTENNAKPDFLFPDFGSYHNPVFPTQNLRILGAKTTCKDRWRQVLSEAARISVKHLVTLEPAISLAQTEEMRSHQLQLVIPQAIHATYTPAQQGGLMTLDHFIREIRRLQANC